MDECVIIFTTVRYNSVTIIVHFYIFNNKPSGVTDDGIEKIVFAIASSYCDNDEFSQRACLKFDVRTYYYWLIFIKITNTLGIFSF